MILHRLKDIIRASISEQYDRLKDVADFDFEDWKRYDDDYEKTKQQYEQTSREYEQYQQQSNSSNSHNTSQTGNKEADYYQVLEVPYGASFDQIKKSYRRLMKMYHPDLFHGDKEKHEVAMEISRKLNEAYVYFEQKHGK